MKSVNNYCLEMSQFAMHIPGFFYPKGILLDWWFSFS